MSGMHFALYGSSTDAHEHEEEKKIISLSENFCKSDGFFLFSLDNANVYTQLY